MRARTPRALLIVCTLLGAPALRAETLYVIERLVVGVYSEADGSGERIAMLKSGDRVELLERSAVAAHVRLADGREGWVPASYLSAEEPLRAQLAQRDAEIAQLKADVSRLTAPPPVASAGPSALGGGATAAPAAPPAPPPEGASAPPRGAWFTTADASAAVIWPWALGAALLALPLGFALGWRTLDRQIRRKYGGLRIY